MTAIESLKREEARAFRTLARLALARGSHDEAEQLAQCALVLYDRLGSRRDAVNVTLDVVKACSERGDHAITERLLAEVEKDARSLGFDRIEGTFLLARSEARLRKGGLGADDLAAMVEELDEAAGMAERSRGRELGWRIEGCRGAVFKLQGKHAEAMAAYVRAMETIRGLHQELPPDLRGSYLEDPDRKRLREEFRALRGK